MMSVSLHKSLDYNIEEYNLAPDIYFQGITRHEAQQWCLSHAFELVELNPQELPDEDGEFYGKQKFKWL